MALGRLAGRRSGEKTIAEVRETERLRSQQGLQGRRIVVGETGGIAHSSTLGPSSSCRRCRGADTSSARSLGAGQTANEWDGAVYLGVTLAAEDLSSRTSRPRASSRPVAEVWPSTQATLVGPLDAPHPASVCVFRFCARHACRPCGAASATPLVSSSGHQHWRCRCATRSPAGATGQSFEPTEHRPPISPRSSRGCPLWFPQRYPQVYV